jgi:hypothetical protein
MSLRASLLRDLENSSLSVNDRVERCCEATRDLENRGEYEEARKALSDYWPRIGEAPKLDGLEPSTAAELLLRVGVLTGIFGAYRQIPRRAGKSQRLTHAKSIDLRSASGHKEDCRSTIGIGLLLLAHKRSGRIT